MSGPLILGPGLKATCVALQLLPLPGVGAIIAGVRNPHSRLLGRGVSQVLLVVFGSWPLIVPGAIGLAWAIWDATRIAKAIPPPAWSLPDPDADPATLEPGPDAQRAQARAAKQARAEARAARKADKARQAQEDETRWMP